MDGRNGGGGYPQQPPPAGKGGGLAIPGMGNRQEAERQRTAAPAAAPPSMGLAIPGMPSRSTPSEGPGLAIPGMPSRSTPSEGPGLAIPGMANRSGAGPTIPGIGEEPSEKGRSGHLGKFPEVSVKVAYVTDTVTTPSNRGKKRGGPVKLSSLEPDGGLIVAHQDSEASNRRTSGRSLLGVATASQNSLPRWASSTGPRPYQSTASLQSDGFANSSFLSWAPQQFVQSWHQKLSQKYRDYNMVNMVGEGRHGAVFIVQHKHSEEYYACKLLNKLDNEVSSMRTEIETMRRLDHPNVVRLFETLEDAENVFLLMELCHGGDLFNRITSEKEGRLVEDVARTFSEQMLSALAYCHGKGIVHRDVKPENFLLYTDDPTCEMLKLADFGIATSIRPVHVNLGSRSTSDFEQSMPIDRVASGTASFALSELQNKRRSFHSGGSEEFCGSLPYMAPELLSRQARGGRKGVEQAPAVDVWSTGIVIYVMLSGDLPYGADPELICSEQKTPFESEVWRGVSQPAKDIILKLVNHSVEQRWTAKQGLRHEWILSGLPPVEGSSFSSPDSKRDLATRVLHHLRRWSQMSKLQRIAIGAIAKRLDAQHPAQKLAEQVYRTFGDASETLQCERLVEAMSAVLCDGENQSVGPPVEKTRSGSENSGLSSPSESSYSSFGGFRQRMLGPQLAVKNSLRMVKESISGVGGQRGSRTRSSGDGRYLNGESGTPTEKRGSTQESPSLDVVVSPSELRALVRMLDSTKTGTVIYTLLVAAFLPADAFSDDRKIKEVFDMFDVRKKGGIGAEDLAQALGKHRDSDVKKLALSIAEFDRNRDGMLDFKEFRQMVRGDAVAADVASTPPQPSSSAAAAPENPAPRKSTIRHL